MYESKHRGISDTNKVFASKARAETGFDGIPTHKYKDTSARALPF